MADIHVWETLMSASDQGPLRRMRVPGGWLYQMASVAHLVKFAELPSTYDTINSWHAPVYVPDLSVNRVAKQNIEDAVSIAVTDVLQHLGSSHPNFASHVAKRVSDALVLTEFK